MLAIDLTWQELTEPVASRYEPWTAAAQWRQRIADRVIGFGGVLLTSSPFLLAAAFGIPQTLEQMPRRAVQAALAIRHLVAEARPLDGLEPYPDVRMAVHMGQILVDVQARDPSAGVLARDVRAAEAIDHPYSLIYACLGVGVLSLHKGNLRKAIPMLERGLALCQVANSPILFPEMASSLGYTYALSGRVAEGLSLLEQAMEQAASMHFMAYHSVRASWLREGYLLAGRVDDAISLAGQGLELARTHQEHGHEAWALRLLGEIAARREPPDVEQAERHYQQALARANALDMRPLLAHCHLGLGSLYRRVGRLAPAQAELTAAVELFRAMDMRFWLPRAEAELVQAK